MYTWHISSFVFPASKEVDTKSDGDSKERKQVVTTPGLCSLLSLSSDCVEWSEHFQWDGCILPNFSLMCSICESMSFLMKYFIAISLSSLIPITKCLYENTYLNISFKSIFGWWNIFFYVLWIRLEMLECLLNYRAKTFFVRR